MLLPFENVKQLVGDLRKLEKPSGWDNFPRNRQSLCYVCGQAAIWPDSFGCNVGSSAAHSDFAMGQRGWKLHPVGLFNGDGISPFSAMRFSRAAVGFGCGTADNSAREYG